jgi:hypothetical protein
MKGRTIGHACFFLCLVLLGIFIGIWMDWSEWLSHGSSRHIYYKVNGQGVEAHLVVQKHDTVHLIGPDGKPGTLQMNFLGGNKPCSAGDAPGVCTVNSATDGLYFFSCDTSDHSYSCHDPAIQQSPSPGPRGPGFPPKFFKALLFDFQHVFLFRTAFDSEDLGSSSGSGPGPGARARGDRVVSAAISAVNLAVVYNTGLKQTQVYDLGSDVADQPVSASKGQTINWQASPSAFTLQFVALSPCTTTPAGGSTDSPAVCVIRNDASGPYYYTAQSTVSGSLASVQETLQIN